MRLSDLLALGRTTDGEGRSPVADLAAARWGYPAGAARFWRSSASHVFILGTARRPAAFLRLDPVSAAAPREVLLVAAAVEQLAARGFPAVRPVRSLAGALAEPVTTPLGPMTATLLPAAAGTWREPRELAAPDAGQLGGVLAMLHQAPLTLPLPDREPDLLTAADNIRDDPGLQHAVRRLHRCLAALSASGLGATGPVHGDLEVDNVCFDDGRPTCYDFGEFGTGYLLRDVAAALRCYRGHPRLRDAFLDGYLTRRGIPGRQRRAIAAVLPAFDVLQRVHRLLQMAEVLDVNRATHDLSPGERWVIDLGDKLATAMHEDRRAILTWSRNHAH